MNEEKKKVAKLDQDKMEDVKGGIPYDEPALIPLDDAVVVEPGEPGDPGGVIVVGTGTTCADGSSVTGGSCLSGYRNVGACGNGYSVVYP
jgi:hypothetical protein